MPTEPKNYLCARRLRANPAYELVLFDRLPASEQQALDALGRDPDGFGILRPRTGGGLTIKSVSREIALLWFTLQTPGLLPRYAIRILGEQGNRIIGQMILDGILEIEAGGQMLSGPAAQALVSGGRVQSEPQSRLATLSRQALEYAEALEITNAVELSARLYMYNRLPASPHWHRLLADDAAVETHLGLRDGVVSLLLAGWERLHSADATRGWIIWQSRSQPFPQLGPAATYKLYVSPRPEAVREGFRATAEVAVRSRAFQFKVGRDIYGLLRPDKIVVYFREFSDLQETAARILEKLPHCPAHGVPFTAELAGKGLLSWGLDPSSDEHCVSWLERESWRLRICNRLAVALLLAKTSSQARAPAWHFALDRLRLEGIDTETWAPTLTSAWTQPVGR